MHWEKYDTAESLCTQLGLKKGCEYLVEQIGNCQHGITLRINGNFRMAHDFKFISRVGEHRSSRTGRLLCGCGKGYASEDMDGEHYGLCSICFAYSLSCAERRKRKLKLM